jgi:5,10-methenyltetrahydromethanopterin hydrogenase
MVIGIAIIVFEIKHKVFREDP